MHITTALVLRKKDVLKRKLVGVWLNVKMARYPIGLTLVCNKNYPMNWNILVIGEKEINRDFISSGERI